ncbi:hypothetical protein AGMMS50293_08150 [Spirochaetia bacterium]|nr:hypothetical protein AGMMS50293_08150 [Spirochaetia bacterium]
MKDKKKNTSAVSIFGPATATSANGNASNSISKTTSTVNIAIDVAGLIAKGKELLSDETIDTSSGKITSFRALGKVLLKDIPELAGEFEKTTNLSGAYKLLDSSDTSVEIENKRRSHQYAVEAIKRGIEFLESLE